MLYEVKSKYYHFIFLFVLLIFFSSFINIPFNASLQLASIILSIFYIIFIALSFFHIIKKGTITIDTFTLLYSFLFCVYIVSFLISEETTYRKILSLRENVIYLFISIFIYKFLKSEKIIDKLLKTIYRLGFFFGVFGIFQFIFRQKLPKELLVPSDYPLFGYYGTDIVRANGMIGNMIIYGSFMLLFYTIFINKFFNDFKLKSFLASVVSFIAIICTFSRAAIIGFAVITVVTVFVSLFKRNNRIVIICLFFSISIVLISLIFFADRLSNTFIFNTLITSNNVNIQSSNEGHLLLITESLKYIKDNPFFGAGISTQKAGSLYSISHIHVTDGAFFATLLETGLIGISVYSFLILYVFYISIKVRKIKKYKYLATGFLYFSVYNFLFASFINSAYIGRTLFVIYWALFGIIYSIYKINKNQIKFVHKSNVDMNTGSDVRLKSRHGLL